MTRSRRRFAVLFVVMALSGCATLPTPAPERAPEARDAPFTLSGRISARHGSNGVAGGFKWTHAPPRDRIDLADPLGQTLARLDGEPGNVTVRLADGRVENATTWNELTRRALGVTIPVEGLAFWIRGRGAPGSQATIERDGQGRVSALRQDGWDIAYAYEPPSTMPHRVTLTYPGSEPVEVRVVVDRVQ
ncbi:MAG TPA: lipoprotein insertase outer membrane protein LolB [Casimicrobiaceae bacterium]|nr:lipoprotein insertase outer membrane protein LolB [Casimicrobiaceae bacterium]